MKILLVAVNAKYIHSNLAVYSLKAYAEPYKEYINIKEFTINNLAEEILREIYKEQAEVIAFSCYIWNISLITELIGELKKVQPGVKIWLGGPEVSYHSGEFLKSHRHVDGIVVGEGEQTFLELVEYYLERSKNLEEISGVVFRESARNNQGEPMALEVVDTVETVEAFRTVNVAHTAVREPMSLDEIPFPYDSLEHLQNRIVYYESSRGCPYSCSYCLSSVDRRVRLRSTGLVKKELQFFLDHQVAQVKFVDRTFNCNRQHALEIWRYVKEHDNGITNFHFEITADLLSEEELILLASLRPGQIQLEIGVQTTNPDTMAAIHRKVDFQKLSQYVTRIREGHNIHQHLDLIAGLPLENLDSFTKSFNDVYGLKPDQLQLGFLKVLKGSPMEKDSDKYGIVCRDTPPYEVLYTGELSFREILQLKSVCEMVEIYYNSGQFYYTLEYLGHFYESPMELFSSLGIYYEAKGFHRMAHSRAKRYEILVDFYKDKVLKLDTDSCVNRSIPVEPELFCEILLLDMYLREDLKSRPYFAKAPIGSRRISEIREERQLGKVPFHVEHFSYDVIASAMTGLPVLRDIEMLFRYDKRDPIHYSAETAII